MGLLFLEVLWGSESKTGLPAILEFFEVKSALRMMYFIILCFLFFH